MTLFRLSFCFYWDTIYISFVSNSAYVFEPLVTFFKIKTPEKTRSGVCFSHDVFVLNNPLKNEADIDLQCKLNNDKLITALLLIPHNVVVLFEDLAGNTTFLGDWWVGFIFFF